MMSTGIASAEYTVMIPLPQEGFSGRTETPQQPVRDLKVTPNVINRGNTAALNWNYNDLEEISIQGYSSYTSTNKSGTFHLSPTVNTTYTVVIKHGGETTTQQISISVNQPAPTAEFTASALKIGRGDAVNLIWNTENVEFIEIVGLLSKTEYTNTSYSIMPNVTATYTLIAYGYEGQGNITKTVTIEVESTAVINSFIVDKTKASVGDSATFSWDVKDSQIVKFNGTNETELGSRAVPFSTPGQFTYKLEVTSFNGLVISSEKVVDVYAMPSLSALAVNGVCCGITVAPNTELNFVWNDDGVSTYVLNGAPKTGGAMTITSSAVSSTTNYIMVATNPAGGSVTRGIAVSVLVPAPVITSIKGSTTVFRNAPFSLQVMATGATGYTIKSSGGSGSGISGTVDMGSTSFISITPTAAGTYTYTMTAKNDAGGSVTDKIDVTVVNDPAISSFTTSASNVGSGNNFTLSWSVSNAETLSIDRSVGVVTGSSKVITAPSTSGSYVYTLTNSKTLAGVTRTATKSVTINVAVTPVITSFTGPATQKQFVPMTLKWTGNNAVYYTLAGSGANAIPNYAGEATIAPQTTGTLTYTLTAYSTESLSVISTRTLTVVVSP